jgi:hypothetical protein
MHLFILSDSVKASQRFKICTMFVIKSFDEGICLFLIIWIVDCISSANLTFRIFSDLSLRRSSISSFLSSICDFCKILDCFNCFITICFWLQLQTTVNVASFHNKTWYWYLRFSWTSWPFFACQGRGSRQRFATWRFRQLHIHDLLTQTLYTLLAS